MALTDREAISYTEKILKELEEILRIDSSELHKDQKREKGEQKFPHLADIELKTVRALVVRGWLNGDTTSRGGNIPSISGGASFRIIGPGPLWLAYKQAKLTVGIAKDANKKSWLAIGVALGGLIATAIWFFYTLSISNGG